LRGGWGGEIGETIRREHEAERVKALQETAAEFQHGAADRFTANQRIAHLHRKPARDAFVDDCLGPNDRAGTDAGEDVDEVRNAGDIDYAPAASGEENDGARVRPIFGM
jgi:hypothetical protein